MVDLIKIPQAQVSPWKMKTPKGNKSKLQSNQEKYTAGLHCCTLLTIGSSDFYGRVGKAGHDGDNGIEWSMSCYASGLGQGQSLTVGRWWYDLHSGWTFGLDYS